MWYLHQSEKRLLVKLAKNEGTPLYVYHKNTLNKEANKYINLFSPYNVKILYAFKANSNKDICSFLKSKGFGADVVSGGELKLALNLGFKEISFSGVGKTEDEIRYAIKNRISFINIESYEEFLTIKKIAKQLKTKASVSVRVNPAIDVETHKYIRTAQKYSKFGIDFKTAFEIYKDVSKSRYLFTDTIHFHLGSQIFNESFYSLALRKVVDFVKSVSVYGTNIKSIDIGGGWGVKEGKEAEGHYKLLKVIKPYLDRFRFILEPGRSVVASCGVLLIKVLYRKKVYNRYIVIVDGGMNNLIRPALYGAFHPIINLFNRKNNVICDIAGPLCESSDYFGKGLKMPLPCQGDILAVSSCGAYASSMANEYNLREKAREFII